MDLVHPVLEHCLKRSQCSVICTNLIQPATGFFKCGKSYRQKIVRDGGCKRDQRRNENIVGDTSKFGRPDGSFKRDTFKRIQRINKFFAHSFLTSGYPFIEGVL